MVRKGTKWLQDRLANGDVPTVSTEEVNTTLYADTIAELNQQIADTNFDRGFGDQTGAKFVLPEGTLTPSASDLPIQLDSGAWLTGQGKEATNIQAPSGYGGNLIEIDGSGGVAIISAKVTDMLLNGDSAGVGVFTDVAQKLTFRDLYIQDFNDGVQLNGAKRSELTNLELRGNGRDGIRIGIGSNGEKVGETQIVGGHIANCGGNGINFSDGTGGSNNLIAGMEIAKSNKYAIRTENVKGLYISVHAEGNGSGLDRDSNGDSDPVDIGISPDAVTDNVSEAVTIEGCIISPSNNAGNYATGVKLGNVKGVEITGNQWTGDADQRAIELGQSAEGVQITPDNSFDSNWDRIITPPLDGSKIKPTEINGGEWRTDVFPFDDMIGFNTAWRRDDPANGIDVIFTSDIEQSGQIINGSVFPQGTTFKSLGYRRIYLHTTGSGNLCAQLERPKQSAENLRLESDNSTTIQLQAADQLARDLEIAGAGFVGVDASVNNQSLENIRCISGQIGNDDIRLEGDGQTVIGCDAQLNTSNATNFGTAGNVDVS